ncbi:MAG: CHASE sensor domain-containing protein, partial [Duganella sp.]
MSNHERSGLSQRLTILSVLSAGSALLLVLIAFAFTSVLSHQEEERHRLETLAAVIGTNSETALRRRDSAQADQQLAPLGHDRYILQAALYDSDEQLLAHYAPVRPALAWIPSTRVHRAVLSRGEPTGAVVIERSELPMWVDILKNLGAACVTAVLAFMTALLIAARSRGSVAEPVARLIAAAQQVSRGQP